MVRDAHHDGVGFAGMRVEEFQAILYAAGEVHQEVMGLITTAVGEEPATESGRNARDMMAGVDDKIREIIGICENVKAELNRYAGGF